MDSPPEFPPCTTPPEGFRLETMKHALKRPRRATISDACYRKLQAIADARGESAPKVLEAAIDLYADLQAGLLD